MRKLLLAVPALLFVIGYACSDNPVDPVEEDLNPSSLTVKSGAGQTGVVGEPLSSPLIAVVKDQHGEPLPGVSVGWAVSGGGSVSDGTTTTDRYGQAQVTWTLGGPAGGQTATASVSGLPRVEFGATGTPDRAAVVELEFSAFEPAEDPAAGDTAYTFVALGDSLQLEVSARDRFDNSLEDISPLFELSDSSVVQWTGQVAHSISAGESRLTVTVDTATEAFVLIVDPAVSELTVAPDSLMFTVIGDTVRLKGVAQDRNGNGITSDSLTWTSSDTAVVEVSSDGVVRARSNGTTSVVAEAGGARDSAWVQVASPPLAPDSLAAVAVSASAVDLSWTDASDNEAGFEISRSLGGSSWSVLDTVGVDAVTYQDTALSPVTTYYYRVRACNVAGCSDYTAADSATTHDVAPAAPDSLAALAVSASAVGLSWMDASDNETGFEISRGLDGSSWSVLDTVGVDVVTYQDTALSPATTYHYRVRACNEMGCSDYTAPDSATTGDVPPVPGNLTVSAPIQLKDAAAVLNWSGSTGAQSRFEVQRRRMGTGVNDGWVTVFDSVPGNANTVTDQGVEPLGLYQYAVRACSGTACSNSAIDSVAVPRLPATFWNLDPAPRYPNFTVLQAGNWSNLLWQILDGSTEVQAHIGGLCREYPGPGRYAVSGDMITCQFYGPSIRGYRVEILTSSVDTLVILAVGSDTTPPAWSERHGSVTFTADSALFHARGSRSAVRFGATSAFGHEIQAESPILVLSDTTTVEASTDSIEAKENGSVLLAALDGWRLSLDSIRVDRVPVAVATPDSIRFRALADTLVLEAEVLDGNGYAIDSEGVEWRLGDTATVSFLRPDTLVSRTNGATMAYATHSAGIDSTRVRVQQEVHQVVVPDQRRPYATASAIVANVLDPNGFPVDTPYVWVSNSPGVLEVLPDGSLRGRGGGVVSLEARVGALSGSGTITLEAGAFTRLAGSQGADHSGQFCGINDEGVAHCWTSLGLPTALDTRAFSTWSTQGTATIDRELFHGCATDAGGGAYCWGANYLGAFGNAAYSNLQGSSVPVPVVDSSGSPLQLEKIAVSSEGTSCGLTAGGTAYCWGNNSWGQAGDGVGRTGDNSAFFTPIRVRTDLTFSSISPGVDHTCAVGDGTGKVYCWGLNTSGQIGNELMQIDTLVWYDPYEIWVDTTYWDIALEPTQVTTETPLVSVVSDSVSSCALSDAGQVYCWGTLPTASGMEKWPTPRLMWSTPTFSRIDLSGSSPPHGCGITLTGDVYCWGPNAYGQLGDGTTRDSFTPVRADLPLPALDVAAGGHSTCAIVGEAGAIEGAIYCWGQNFGPRPVEISPSTRYSFRLDKGPNTVCMTSPAPGADGKYPLGARVDINCDGNIRWESPDGSVTEADGDGPSGVCLQWDGTGGCSFDWRFSVYVTGDKWLRVERL